MTPSTAQKPDDPRQAADTGTGASCSAPGRPTPSPAAWPASEVGRALAALLGRCRLAGSTRTPGVVPEAPLDEGCVPERWVEATVSGLGAEAEEVACTYPEIEACLRRAGPALLASGEEAGPRYLVLLGGRRSKLRLLTPDGRTVRMPAAAVRAWLCRGAEARAARTADEILEAADVPAGRRARARAGLVRDQLRSHRVSLGWIVRSSPAGPLVAQAREFGLGPLLGLFLTGHTLCTGFWIASWWILGAAVLRGHVDGSRLLGWGLAVASLVPCRTVTTYAIGAFSVRAGALLKQRLMFGATRLATDEVRAFGAGQLLGRILESEMLDTMVLTGGFLSLMALIELVFACVILATGAAGLPHALLLVAALLVRHHARCHERWTAQRVSMTDKLVERLVGHRTRLAQESRAEWHAGEDEELAEYVQVSRELDRAGERLRGLLPRGWFLVGLLGLAPAFLLAAPSAGSLGVAVGGILIAYQALRNLADGVERLVAGRVAWERIRPFWEAGRAKPDGGQAKVDAGPVAASTEADAPALLEARGVAFRFPGATRPVIRSADLCLGGSERVLLDGASGSGKTTLAVVLAGLREAQSGSVLLKGSDRKAVGDESWRRRVALTPQFYENHVLLGSLAFNLLMGRQWPPEPGDLEEAEQLCRELGLGPLLGRMPSGIQQLVGETGWQLSHGEKSRIYVARALLQRGEVVILDEGLAALDPGTLQTALRCVLERAPTLLLTAQP